MLYPLRSGTQGSCDFGIALVISGCGSKVNVPPADKKSDGNASEVNSNQPPAGK